MAFVGIDDCRDAEAARRKVQTLSAGDRRLKLEGAALALRVNLDIGVESLAHAIFRRLYSLEVSPAGTSRHHEHSGAWVSSAKVLLLPQGCCCC